jgi:hypothetical protein
MAKMDCEGGGTWFGKKCQHRLDWFQLRDGSREIEKEFLYGPYGDDFQERLAAHWADLNSMKWANSKPFLPR